MAKCANQTELTRDVYGFAVRPHHLKRYKEYAIIYEEEETERSTRWERFLNTYCDESVEAGHDARRADCLTKENGGSRKFETWNELRPRLYPVEKALKSRFRKIHVCKDNGSVPTAACLVETHQSSGQIVSEDESDDEFYDVERSDMIQDSHSSTDASVDESDGEKDDDENACPWKEELDALVRGGVPMAMRGELWQIFMGASIRRLHGHYQALLASLTIERGNNGSGGFHNNDVSEFKISDRCVIEKWANQIEKDLPRTFPGHPALDEDGRNALRHLLTAYAQHNPNVGYCQAMNFFAGLLLLMMSEENAFWTLVGVLDDCFEGYYSEKMLESQVDQLVLEELLREHFPRLMSHLDALGLQVAWVTGPWFLSIFVNILPWETVLRVWDVLLYEGNRSMLFKTTLALMELYGSAIIATKDAGDVVTILQSFAASTFDSSQLVLTACVAYQSINELQLQELREKYRPQVLAKFSGQSIEKPMWHKACGPIIFSSERQGLSCQPFEALSTASEEDIKDSQEYSTVKNSAGKMFVNDDIFLGVENNGNGVLDLVHQVKCLKLELSKALEEKQAANLRAEELETAFMELVKEDNRRLLAAKIETLEAEVAYLKRALKEKTEQEQAMIQVMVRMEHEQKVTEDARRFAEEDAKAQRELMNALEVKYNAAMASIKELEKRTAMAESTLNATLQYQTLSNGHLKQSPTSAHIEESSRWSWSWTTSKPADSDGISVAPARSKLDGIENGSVSISNDASQNQGLLTRRFSLSWKDIVKAKIGPPHNSQSEVAEQQNSQFALTSGLETVVLPSPSTDE